MSRHTVGGRRQLALTGTMSDLSVHIPSGLRPDYLQVLSETATLLLADSEPRAVCELLFRQLSNVLQLDAYFHYLVSEDGTHLELASCAGVPESEMPRLVRLEFGQAVCGTVAKNCQWMYVPGVQARGDEMTGLIRGYGIRC
jgi:putative methionine-R-sulfoxide reductase with GAF domain